MAAIRVLLGFLGLADGELLARTLAVIAALTGNPHFTNLPFDLALLKTAADTFSTLIAEALDGSKKVIAEKDKQRAAIVKMLKQLAIHVEANSNEDPAILTSSGFEIASTTRTPAPATLSKPGVKAVKEGKISGQILALLRGVKGAKSYQLEATALVNGVASGTPIFVMASDTRAAVAINNLTPGTIYSIKVRALGSSEYTDWSDAAIRMCL